MGAFRIRVPTNLIKTSYHGYKKLIDVRNKKNIHSFRSKLLFYFKNLQVFSGVTLIQDVY
jgi:hypothetical protein